MALSQREAATQWCLGRTTIQRAIKSGKLSLTTDKQIDAAEMLRVFGEPGPAAGTNLGPPKTTHDAAGLEVENSGLKAEIAGLKATLAATEAHVESLREAMLRLTHAPSQGRRWWPWRRS